ncbi:MAG: AI-2E family transporter [Salinibacter sp.]
MPESNTDVSISGVLDGFRRRIRGILFVGSVGILLYFLWDIARLFLIAAIIAYLLDPLVRRFQGIMGRMWATLLVLGILVGSLIGVGIGVQPVLQQQLNALPELKQMWDQVSYIEEQLSALSTRLRGGPVDFNLRERLNQMISGQPFSKMQDVLGLAMNIMIVPFLAVFLLRDGPRIKRGLIRLVPNRYFEFSLEAIHKIDLRLGSYLRGVVVQNTIVGGLAIGVLWALGVPSFILLGLVIGLTNFIPYFGPLVGISLVVFIQLAHAGSAQAGLVLIALLGIQLLDEVLIVPVVFGKAVDLHPLEVLLALWIAAQFFGVLGIVLAIPVASAGKVVLTEATSLIQQYRFSHGPE